LPLGHTVYISGSCAIYGSSLCWLIVIHLFWEPCIKLFWTISLKKFHKKMFKKIKNWNFWNLISRGPSPLFFNFEHYRVRCNNLESQKIKLYDQLFFIIFDHKILSFKIFYKPLSLQYCAYLSILQKQEKISFNPHSYVLNVTKNSENYLGKFAKSWKGKSFIKFNSY